MKVIYFLLPCVCGFFSNIKTFLLNNMKKQEYKEWWYDPRIHNFGNIGLGGWIHSRLAPYATMLIDNNAYDGKDVRSCAAKKISRMYPNANYIIDLGCGTGTSTQALYSYFPNAKVLGVDTSEVMLEVARERVNGFIGKPYYIQDQAHFLTMANNSFDISVSMYMFHETPLHGIELILEEMNRVTIDTGLIVIVDIATEYVPSFMMETGEPYVHDYIRNVVNLIDYVSNKYNKTLIEEDLIKGHVTMWIIK